MFKKKIRNFGPGPLIAAAFIGPGTVTLCTLAGVKYGTALLWTIVIAIFGTMILQAMAVKVGIVLRKSITQVLKEELQTTSLKYGVIGLVFISIVVGNTAYEAGNISGAVLGLETLFGGLNLDLGTFSLNLYSLLVGFISASLLWTGKYKVIEGSLIGLVVLMSISFLFTAILTGPSFKAIFQGLFSFDGPEGSLLMVIGLVGTTIVPYNLFLHTELVKEKWFHLKDLNLALKDMFISLGIGGLISLCIIITASGTEISEINSASDLALSLEPMFGSFAKYFLSLGLFAAGITSTITAPLAAAYVVCSCFSWTVDLKSKHFKFIWLFIILFGVILSATGLELIFIIQLAQITNGFLLPIIAALLIWVMNKTFLLGNFKNTFFQNVLGSLIVLLSLFLSIRTLLLVIK